MESHFQQKEKMKQYLQQSKDENKTILPAEQKNENGTVLPAELGVAVAAFVVVAAPCLGDCLRAVRARPAQYQMRPCMHLDHAGSCMHLDHARSSRVSTCVWMQKSPSGLFRLCPGRTHMHRHASIHALAACAAAPFAKLPSKPSKKEYPAGRCTRQTSLRRCRCATLNRASGAWCCRCGARTP